MHMTPTLALLGTGRMGSALARTLNRHGAILHVWNRTRSRAEPLTALGVRIMPTVTDAVAAASLVLISVDSYSTSQQLLDDAHEALRGKLVVQLTSGSPRQARAQAAWADAHAIEYVDGAILVTPDMIGDPAATILYAGPRELFERCQTALAPLGAARWVGPDIGHAAALDMALLALFWGAMFGALQGAAVASAERFPLDGYAAALGAMAPVVQASAQRMVKRIHERRFAIDETTRATVATHHTGVAHLVELCSEHAIDRALPDAFARLLAAAMTAGHANDELAVIATLLCGVSTAGTDKPTSTK
jgi:3-hydroxyisobutyrate dehydrogenase-like beta-hydroxyacid dehydrogenase